MKRMTPEEARLLQRMDQATAQILEIEPLAAVLLDTLTTGERRPCVTLTDHQVGVLAMCAMYGIVAARDKRREMLAELVAAGAIEEPKP